MLYTLTIMSVLEVLIVTLPILFTVAFITVAERKTMASMQRRLGPNAVGWYGLLQAFADALKLLLKEYISPTQANIILFFLGPIITLIFSLLGYAVIPFGPGLVLLDYNLGVLYLLAMSSLSTYGILLAGWSANSKYAFLGSLRSTAQLISYELVLSSAILLVVMLIGSLDITGIIEAQKSIWYTFPLLPIFIVFFIGSIAETNRAPFDLAEAESELVSGFMTEHSAVIFVFFFLAEYASIVLICIFNSILFLGGYLLNFNYFNYFIYPYILLSKYTSGDNYMYITDNGSNYNLFSLDNYTISTVGAIFGIILGIKTCIMIFTFIWARASFPRTRYDQLMSYCWTVLLPIVIAFIIIVPCILYSSEILPYTNLIFSFSPTLITKVGDDHLYPAEDQASCIKDDIMMEGVADIKWIVKRITLSNPDDPNLYFSLMTMDANWREQETTSKELHEKRDLPAVRSFLIARFIWAVEYMENNLIQYLTPREVQQFEYIKELSVNVSLDMEHVEGLLAIEEALNPRLSMEEFLERHPQYANRHIFDFDSCRDYTSAHPNYGNDQPNYESSQQPFGSGQQPLGSGQQDSLVLRELRERSRSRTRSPTPITDEVKKLVEEQRPFNSLIPVLSIGGFSGWHVLITYMSSLLSLLPLVLSFVLPILDILDLLPDYIKQYLSIIYSLSFVILSLQSINLLRRFYKLGKDINDLFKKKEYGDIIVISYIFVLSILLLNIYIFPNSVDTIVFVLCT